MRELFVRVKYLTFLWSFGLGQATPQFTLKHINGSGLGSSYWSTLMDSWMTARMSLSLRWTTLQQRFSQSWTRRPSWLRTYPAKHRDVLGSRQTYAGQKALRAERDAAWHNWQAFLDMKTPSIVGVASFPATGSRAYRGLAPSILDKETVDLVRRYAPKDWLDD